MPIDPISIHQGVKNGDTEAETELILFLRNLFCAEYERTLGPLAEDYLQELGMRVIESIREGRVNDPEKLIPYCQGLAAHVRIDGLRVAVRQARKLVAIDEARFEQSSENAEATAVQAEQFRTVLKLMERLDPLGREVVRRYYFERQPPAEIEGELEIPHTEFQAVKDRAVEKLRRDYRTITNAQGWELLRGKKKPEPEAWFAWAA
jgi:RNA polymerase sigma factor (sigma-70 family)